MHSGTATAFCPSLPPTRSLSLLPALRLSTIEVSQDNFTKQKRSSAFPPLELLPAIWSSTALYSNNYSPVVWLPLN